MASSLQLFLDCFRSIMDSAGDYESLRSRFDSSRERHMPSKFSVARKSKLLGMPFGTASGRLRKMLMFSLVQRLGIDICHQCKRLIETTEELSIEHESGWQLADDPVHAFFDLSQVSFSHLDCNIRAGARPTKIYASRREKNRAYSRAKRKNQQGEARVEESRTWNPDAGGQNSAP